MTLGQAGTPHAAYQLPTYPYSHPILAILCAECNLLLVPWRAASCQIGPKKQTRPLEPPQNFDMPGVDLR